MSARRSFSSRGETVEEETDEDGDSAGQTGGGFIKVFLNPLEQANYNVILGWLGIRTGGRTQGRDGMANIPHIGVIYGGLTLFVTTVLYQILMTDLGYLFQRLCGIIEPIFSIICAFYWLAVYFRRTWSATSIYILFCACFAGEFLGQCMCDGTVDNYITQPFLSLIVLVAVSIASLFSTLQTIHSVFVIGFVSFVRFLACTSLGDLPQITRPFLAYFAGIMGTIGAKYMETALKDTVKNPTNQEGKIPIIKRRRSSTAAPHSFTTHRAGRRTSLPALMQKPQTSGSSYESAIIGEAHGLISDMLADSTLPPHVVSGLTAVSNLLKPQDSHGPVHKPRVSPLVSLTETTNYGSDSEEIPYTGERPSSLPKRLRRSLPPSLIRRMSTSTWTTTTSATGLPTLEPEPCRTRSCSFRHSRDNTPGSSPTNSRSNSPSPSSPTTISLTIPKSRSFSTANNGSSGGSQSSVTNQRRGSRERRSYYPPGDATPSPVHGNDKTGPPGKGEADGKDSLIKHTSGKEGHTMGLSKRFNITSDYESSDSPSSSDHSDNVMTMEEMGSASPGRPLTDLTHHDILHKPTDMAHSHQHQGQPAHSHQHQGQPAHSQPHQGQPAHSQPHQGQPADTQKISNERSGPRTNVDCSAKTSCHTSITSTTAVPSTHPAPSPSQAVPSTHPPPSQVTLQDARSSLQGDSHDTSSLRGIPHDITSSHKLLSETDELVLETEMGSADSQNQQTCSVVVPFTSETVMNNKLLSVNQLNQWDYPVFDLSDDVTDCILSMVACRIFSETGLFETFRVPMAEFISYFHALELGYRDKPYHNRIHATDVLHGVYYLTTQPIPGFLQINPDGDVFHNKASSSESDSDCTEKGCARTNFTAEDTYGIMGGNLPPLELMALFTAAAMHDYDHPGRTNAFLVTTNAPMAILYNDRSVLESHHAAAAWRLYLTNPSYHWLVHLDKAEFKRFRFLVIEAILATDLKRHFELLAEFNAKVNDEDATGIDWTSESDRLMASNMVIKMADINGPAKHKELHVNWTNRISEEFYEQGDEEQGIGLPISPYMDRKHPQLAKLQESFINHLVAPLCNALGAAGLLPGTWVEGDETDVDIDLYKDSEDENSAHTVYGERKQCEKKIECWLTKNLKDNHDMWVKVLKQEAAQKDRDNKQTTDEKKESRNSLTLTDIETKQEMEPITEEDTPPNSAHGLSEELTNTADRLMDTQSSSQSETLRHRMDTGK